MKKLTVAWLKEKSACGVGIEWFRTCGKEKPSDVMDALLSEKKLAWANWLIARLLSRKDSIRYAIFAAEQVIGIFERRYPDDKHPRQAIEAAKAVLKKNSKTTRAAAWAAGDAAWDVARAARDAAWAAAWDAGDAARDAAWDAAWASGSAAWSAARAAWSAAWDARDAAWAAAWDAGDAARDAAWDAAWVSGSAAWSAARAAWSAAWDAGDAARDAAREETFEKIIRYGMGLCFGRGA